jgi:hypothetical protein
MNGAPPVPGKFYKEVKKKHFCAGWNFSCFSALWMEQDLF